MLYKNVEDLFIGNAFSDEPDQEPEDFDTEHMEWLAEQYHFLGDVAFSTLYHYYTEKPVNANGGWSTTSTRFHKGKMKPLALFNRLTKLGHAPVITVE